MQIRQISNTRSTQRMHAKARGFSSMRCNRRLRNRAHEVSLARMRHEMVWTGRRGSVKRLLIFPCFGNHHWGANTMLQQQIVCSCSWRVPSGEVESEAKWTLVTTAQLIRHRAFANRNPMLTWRNDTSGQLFLDTLPTHWNIWNVFTGRWQNEIQREPLHGE